MQLTDEIKNYIALVDKALDYYLPEEKDTAVLAKAMRHSVFAGGKRLRPLLAIAAGIACGTDEKKCLPAACALEMIHTYSLIHDDLPSIDNDDYRRGKLTCHKVFGEAMAILAGDALLTQAFAVLANMPDTNDSTKVALVKEIANAAGIYGMVGGQVVDIGSEGKAKADEATLQYIHTHKTGALINASVRSGAYIAEANRKEIDLLTDYGNSLGLAFQIVDDLLDVTGDEKKIGKKVGKDASLDKMTYPAFYGIDESKKKITVLFENAKQAIEPFGEKGFLLGMLADIIVNRDY